MPKTEENDYDYQATDHPKCPHCDHVDVDWWDGWGPLVHEEVCLRSRPDCCKEYSVVADCSPRFTTDCEEAAL